MQYAAVHYYFLALGLAKDCTTSPPPPQPQQTFVFHRLAEEPGDTTSRGAWRHD